MSTYSDDEDHYESVDEALKKKPENSTNSHCALSPPTSRDNTKRCSKKLATVTVMAFLVLVAAVVSLGSLTVISYTEVRSLQTQNQVMNEMLEDFSLQFQQSMEVALNQSQSVFSYLINTTIPQLSVDVYQTDRRVTDLKVALENNL